MDMHKAITLFLVCLISYPSFCIENNKTWINFKEFVVANLSKKANQETLIKLLNNPNPEEVEFGVRFTINQCKELNAVPVYEAIWNNAQKAFPSLDMAYLRQPTILLAVAGALSKIKGRASEEQYNYVISQINSKDEKTLTFAILALGYVGTESDIKGLIELAKLNDGEYLFQAVFSVLEIDYENGLTALRQLQKEFGHDSSLAEEIDSILKGHISNKTRNTDDCVTGSL